MNVATIGDRVSIYMQDVGMKAADLSRATGITNASLSELLSGKTKDPRLSLLEKIVRKTDISPQFLLTGEGPHRRSEVQAERKLSYREEIVARVLEQRVMRKVEKKIETASQKKKSRHVLDSSVQRVTQVSPRTGLVHFRVIRTPQGQPTKTMLLS